MTRITVLGLGAMGSRIAVRLLDAGHTVTVFNRTAERARPLLEKQGMAISNCVDWLNTLPTTSPAMKAMGQLMAARSFEPLFPINLVEKDFGYLDSLAKQSSTDAPLSVMARDIYRRASHAAYGDTNISGVIQLYTNR